MFKLLRIIKLSYFEIIWNGDGTKNVPPRVLCWKSFPLLNILAKRPTGTRNRTIGEYICKLALYRKMQLTSCPKFDTMS